MIRPELSFFAPDPSFKRGMDDSRRASLRWSPVEAKAVDDAILRAAVELHEFTTDDVWNRLPSDFPITKGIASHMLAAKRRGVILNTTRCVFCTRSRNNNNQRLTIWSSLIHKAN